MKVEESIYTSPYQVSDPFYNNNPPFRMPSVPVFHFFLNEIVLVFSPVKPQHSKSGTTATKGTTNHQNHHLIAQLRCNYN